MPEYGISICRMDEYSSGSNQFALGMSKGIFDLCTSQSVFGIPVSKKFAM